MISTEAIEKDLSIIDNTTFGECAHTNSMLMWSTEFYSSSILSDEDDWNDVIIACSSLAPMWQHLSGLLGLPIKTIRTISESYPNDSATSWSQALMQWILQKYNTEKYGSPSWRSLLRAIGMVDKALFNKLAQAHQPRGKCILEYSIVWYKTGCKRRYDNCLFRQNRMKWKHLFFNGSYYI